MRVTHVKKAQKDQGTCGACGQPVTAGMAYKSIKPRYGGKRVRHETCKDWRPSEMTSSKMAGVYAAQEGFEDAGPFETLDDIASALETAADDAESVAEEYRDSISNLPEAFQQGPSAEEWEEKAQAVDDWCEALRSLADEIRGEDPTCSECDATEDDGPHHDYVAPDTEPDPRETTGPGCAVDGCNKPEDDHHDFEVDTADAESRADEAISDFSY